MILRLQRIHRKQLPSWRLLIRELSINSVIISRQIVGILASVERAIADAEERANNFFAGVLDKQHQRLRAVFDRHVVRDFLDKYSIIL